MPICKPPRYLSFRRLIPALAASLLALAAPASLRAAIIQAGDVTSTLGPSFFIDEAANGGTDTDIHQPNAAGFDRDFNRLLTRNQGPTRITLTGLGFATHTSATANDATSVAVTLIYLGPDEVINGGDDVVIGTATGTFVFTDPALNPTAEYVFAFDTPLTTDLTITGTRFRIRVAPSNVGGNGSLKLKAVSPAYDPAFGAKLSVAGVAAPLINPQRVNLAKFQPVTATSVSGQRLASYVTDGVTGNDNRWQGSSSQWQAAQLDFPFPVEVGSAQVFTGVDDTLAINTFYLQYLNGNTWVTIPGASVSGNTNVERNLVFTNPVTASSFRILGQDGNLRIRELALYPPNGPGGYPLGTDLTLNLAYQRPTIASANTPGNFALKAVDGRANGFMWQTDTAGITTLDIDLRVTTKIGSAHVYSGLTGGSPLADFVLKYWNGSAWQNIAGGTVAGNTALDLVVPFTTPVTTTKVRLEFTNPGTTSIRELCIFPANTGNVGYPLGTNLIGSGEIARYETYNDAFYLITNPESGRRFSVPSNGQPALDPAGLTFGQSQYQVLLNLSNGTYRLRNRASGNCLSGAQLDKTPGLLLTDSPYAALPHQDWILDPLGGGAFQFINPWSGLVIDSQGGATAAGTPLVQNTANGSTTQRWQIAKYAGYPKKGIGGTTFAMAFNPSWAYNWGRLNTNPFPEGASFFPMQWGNFSWDIGSPQGPLWQEYSNWRKRPDGIHLLGFNEPDRTDQSNMTMSQVISLWPRLQELDQPLASPSPGTIGGDGGWLDSFYTQADALGYRVDYTAVHTYPGPSGGSANNLINFVNSAYDNYGNRPVWLTEFSFVDWGKNQTWSEEDNYDCLAEFLWRAESNDKLRKYALFVFSENAEWPQPANSYTAVSPAPRSNSYDINGNLTAFGKLYAAWDNDATVQPNKTHMVHHRGLSKRMANAATGTPVNPGPGGRTIRTDGRIVNWTLVPTGVSNRYYIISSMDGRRLSYVPGASNPNNDPLFAAAGTVGDDLEWTLTHNEHGWYYLGHPKTSTRLKLVSFNTGTSVADYQLVDAGTNSDASVQWRFIVAPPQSSWSGASGSSWTTAGSWNPSDVPSSEDTVSFDSYSTANHSTVLNQDFNVLGVRVTNPTAAVTIGGTHSLTLGGYGLDLAAATRDLTINTPVVLGALQGWTVNTNRTLTLGGAVSGNHNLTIGGAGKVSLSASNLLPNGAGTSNLIVIGTLDMNGTTQSINGLSGSGVIDNTAAGTASLTLGNNNASSTTNTVFQNTGGALSLIKTDSGSLTLPSANTHSGGFTNNGTGSINPQNDAAFGTGPVTMDGGTLYATAANYTFANPLTLNGAILRVGGGNNRTLTWTGPVTVTGTSSINADGSTTGVTIDGTLDISGATLGSVCSGVANTINGSITGSTGTLIASSGTFNLNAANTFGGNIRAASGTLIIGNSLAMQNATLDMNAADSGTVNLNNHNATLGALTGSRNLSLGNGTITIGNNHLSTTYSGVLSGNGSLVKTGDGTLTLSRAHNYTGTTVVNGGTLAITGATHSTSAITFTANSSLGLVIGSAVTAANAAVNFTDGRVAVAGTASAPSHVLLTALSFAGTPVLASPVPGYALQVIGNQLQLNQVITDPYDTWKTQITNGQNLRTDDADGDGFTNLHEFLFGTSPIASNGALVTTTPGSGQLVLRWLQRESRATYTLKQSTTLDADSWITVVTPTPSPDTDQNGAPVDYDFHTVTLPTSGERWLFRVEGVEN